MTALLPIDYLVYGNRLILQGIEGPAEKPGDPFICQTEQIQIKGGAQRYLISVNQDAYKVDNLAGFIFHSARCGSTLLCNMLDILPDCYVVRESGIINKLLMDISIDSERKTHLLAAILSMYCDYAHSQQARCVIKFTSYCALHISFLLEKFSELPWVYLYRNPIEVARSLAKKSPEWLSFEFLSRNLLTGGECIPDEKERQIALVLQGCFRRVLDNYNVVDQKALLLSYQQLLNEEGLQVAGHFGFSIGRKNEKNMTSCLAVDAKTGKPRSPEVLDKKIVKESPDLAIRKITEACQKFCWEEYEQLCNRQK